MIKVDQIERIRKLVLVQGVSERQAAKQVGVSRYAVRLALENASPRKYVLARPKPRPVMGKVEKLVEEILRSDEGKPAKQRHTARRIWMRLRDEYGFEGSEPSVRRIVAALRQKPPEVFIPLAHEPGEEAQVDFGEAEVVMNGIRQTVQFFCMKLCYSRYPFVVAFPHQRQEAFFEGHRQGFEFLGGVPLRLTYDNLKVAVRRILEGHDREEQEAFRSLRAHYLFESHFCNPASGNEKGQVESLVGYVRRNALVPVPEVRSFAELNAKLREWCEREASRTVPGTSEAIGERLEADRSKLLLLPVQPFDCARVVPCKVNRYAQVTCDTSVYSVPWQYAYRPATVKAYVDRIEVWIDQKCVAKHDRTYVRNGSVLALDHYLEVFLRKPGALEYAIPFKQAILPRPFDNLHRAFKYHYPRSGDKEFVRVLMFLREYPPDDVLWAVETALQRSTYSADAVRTFLLMGRAVVDAPASLDPDEHPNLPVVGVPQARTDHFNRLLPKGGVVH
jgi:transposase